MGKGGSWGVKNRVEEGEENGEGKRGWGGGVKNEEGEGGKKLMKREKGLRWRRVVGGRVGRLYSSRLYELYWYEKDIKD